MAEARKRTAVFISGRGSNMAALIEAAQRPDYPAEIALVLSNRADAGGLETAREHGIAVAVAEGKRAAMEAALQSALADASIELVCLAGFMRILSAEFVAAWRDRMINIHPSLLPLFPGLDTHARALAAGVKLHGATVHFVRAEMDTGPIIAQGAVPVVSGDTPEGLATRVLQVEHHLYPLALKLVASGRAKVNGDVVEIDGVAVTPEAALMSPPDRKRQRQDTIQVRANIRLLPTEESGRALPIKGSYRPNHNFFEPDNRNMTIGFIELPEGEELHPGESIEVSIMFRNWAGLEGQIYPGRTWRIQEGPKLVGVGTVLEVLATPL